MFTEAKRGSKATAIKAENHRISSLLRVPGAPSGLPPLLINFFVVVIVGDDGGIIVLTMVKFKTLTSLEFSGVKYIHVVVLRCYFKQN